MTCFGLWLISLGAGAYIVSSALTTSQTSPKTNPANITLDSFCEAWEAKEEWEVTHCENPQNHYPDSINAQRKN